MGNERAVEVATKQAPLRRIHYEQPPGGQKVDAHRKRLDADHDLMAVLGIERDHLMRAPIGEPDPPVAPPGRFTKRDSVHQHGHRDKTACPSKTHRPANELDTCRGHAICATVTRLRWPPCPPSSLP